MNEQLTMTERLKAKVRRAGAKGRPASELDARDDVDHATGRMTWKQIVVDRENGRYREQATYRDTSEFVFPPKDELLSEHRGRGSAKSKK